MLDFLYTNPNPQDNTCKFKFKENNTTFIIDSQKELYQAFSNSLKSLILNNNSAAQISCSINDYNFIGEDTKNNSTLFIQCKQFNCGKFCFNFFFFDDEKQNYIFSTEEFSVEKINEALFLLYHNNYENIQPPLVINNNRN